MSVRLRHVAEVNPANGGTSGLRPDAPVSFFPMELVGFGSVSGPGEKVALSEVGGHGFTSFAEGDVLVAKITPSFENGKGAFATDLINGAGIGTTELHVLRPKQIDPYYLNWLVQSMPFRQGGAVEMRGAAGQQRVPADYFASFRIPVTDLEDQGLIADFLDRETHRIDALVDTKQRLIQALLAKREVLTLAAATGALLEGHAMKESSLPWAMSVPRHWDEALLNKVARMGSGHTPSRSRSEWWEDGTIPWITTGEVQQIRDDRIEYLTETREKVSLIGLANSSAVLHPKGTVLLSRTASAGFSGIMGADMATSQDFVTWTCGPQITPRFLLLCLRAMRRDLLERLAQGSTHQTIYMPDIASIKVPLPPIEEQKSIVERFWRVASMIDAAVDNLSLQLDLLAEYRQALITQAVTGQLDEATLKGDRPIDEAVGVIPE